MSRFAWVVAISENLVQSTLTATDGHISIQQLADRSNVFIYGEFLGEIIGNRFKLRTPKYKFGVDSFDIPANEEAYDYVRARILECIANRKNNYRDIYVGAQRVAVFDVSRRIVYYLDAALKFTGELQNLCFKGYSWTTGAKKNIETVFGKRFD